MLVSVSIKRIYHPVDVEDGKRILVDRLWPRGVSKAGAQITAWYKDVAPSTELRKQFGHQMDKFEAFTRQYRLELEHGGEASRLLDELCQLAETEHITLIYAAKDEQHNHAIVLRDAILERLRA